MHEERAPKRRIVARALHRTYKLTLHHLIGRGCRFVPTCSTYWLEAVEKYGWPRGCLMAAWRIMRCHPLHPGGVDPVP